MSESVKIGGIGKNPAIDKINSLTNIDVKKYAVNKMERILLIQEAEDKRYYREVPIDFEKVDWEGNQSGRK